ncbi:GGDEF domain-containing protein [Pseudohalioglobus sediminis]|uniref:diguanylate cyclase n=1 Tax=Pseudohalioglobus sediminis TaxID=2606449 RepID=A0A5B0X8S7_9GAMM|nr:GGDEF domain-containing protein [Pseudohalioglobus sediminis]KAA1194569.1 GGDEF domain-containing protein [Pseudohalioglobus sediminis]
MLHLHWAALTRLLVPACFVSGALMVREYLPALSENTQIVLAALPYLVAAICAVMAYQFRRVRLLLAALGVAALYWLIQNHLQVSLDHPDAARLYLVASLAVPLLCLYLLVLPERGMFNTWGLLACVFFLGSAGACFALADLILGASAGVSQAFAHRPVEGYILSIGASQLLALVAVAGIAALLLRNAEAEGPLLGVLAAGFASLAFLHLESISVVMGIAAGLCLVWGLLRSSYAMAYRDELTGLLGRRALNERLASLGKRYTIAMLDVDHFKRFNDKHGHDVGDEVLKLVASRVREVGNGGTAYRYGGEEFCIVFPRKSSEDCAAALDEVRERIADYKMSIRDRRSRPARSKDGARRRGATRIRSDQVSVTISAGVAAREEDGQDAESVILAADSKLYKAKRSGRNRVVF